MAAGASARDAARDVAREFHVPRRRVYALATSIARSGG